MYLFNYGAYLKTLEEALKFFQNYRGSGTGRQQPNNRIKQEEGVAFPQVGTKKAGPCHHCGGDHWLRWCKTCPEDKKKQLLDQLMQSGDIKNAGGDANVKDAAISFNMFSDESLQECIDGIANVNVGRC